MRNRYRDLDSRIGLLLIVTGPHCEGRSKAK